VSKKETFSMPCAESLCCGTPIVGFKAGAPEQISMGDYSDFVEFGDVDALEKRLRQWLSAQPERQNIAREAEKIYSVNTMIDGFLEVYKKCDWSRKK
jgi:glycosyltransferase involved in cell wall biosynthesis